MKLHSTKRWSVTILSILSVFLICGSASALQFEPRMLSTGPGLLVTCAPDKDTFCRELCDQETQCELPEAYCRSCAGTSNLKLKRLLDEVGNTLFARADRPQSELVRILKQERWITLHPTTIYNYSVAFNSEQLRAQFGALCGLPAQVPADAELESVSRDLRQANGLILLGLDANHHPSKILGAICTDGLGSSRFSWVGPLLVNYKKRLQYNRR